MMREDRVIADLRFRCLLVGSVLLLAGVITVVRVKGGRHQERPYFVALFHRHIVQINSDEHINCPWL